MATAAEVLQMLQDGRVSTSDKLALCTSTSTSTSGRHGSLQLAMRDWLIDALLKSCRRAAAAAASSTQGAGASVPLVLEPRAWRTLTALMLSSAAHEPAQAGVPLTQALSLVFSSIAAAPASHQPLAHAICHLVSSHDSVLERSLKRATLDHALDAHSALWRAAVAQLTLPASSFTDWAKLVCSFDAAVRRSVATIAGGKSGKKVSLLDCTLLRLSLCSLVRPS